MLTLAEELVSRKFEARALLLVDAEPRAVSSQIFGINTQTGSWMICFKSDSTLLNSHSNVPSLRHYSSKIKINQPIRRWFSQKLIDSSMRWLFLTISQTISIVYVYVSVFVSMSVENRRLENNTRCNT